MKLRVGVVGLGNAWEARHRPALCALSERFEVRAICEQVSARAEQAAHEFHASTVDGFRALAQREDIDAVLVLSSQWFGPLPILAACEAGKAVYCSVAPDLAPQQAREVKDRVQAAGIAFMAEFPRRQMPATLRLKELIATRLGPPRILFSHERLAVQTGNGNHLPQGCADAATRHLIELVDWCRYVMGNEPTAVLGVEHQHAQRPGQGEYRMMSLDFSVAGKPGTGPLAQISCGHYMPANWAEAVTFRPPAALQACCENGIAFIDLPSTLIWFDEAGRHLESLETERPVGEQLLSQFYRAVTSLVRKTSDLEDAYRALTVVHAAQQSHVSGQRLPLEF